MIKAPSGAFIRRRDYLFFFFAAAFFFFFAISGWSAIQSVGAAAHTDCIASLLMGVHNDSRPSDTPKRTAHAATDTNVMTDILIIRSISAVTKEKSG